MQLSPHFNLYEFTRSQTAYRKGIDNTPSQEHIANMVALCHEVLEPIRYYWNSPVLISSGYRSPRLNAVVGGSKTSQHSNGMAADIEIMGVDNCDLAEWIINNLDFDQLILEFHNHLEGPNSGWVHVSYNQNRNRHQILTAKRLANGRTKYFSGLVS